jgi:hypothetical protein
LGGHKRRGADANCDIHFPHEHRLNIRSCIGFYYFDIEAVRLIQAFLFRNRE